MDSYSAIWNAAPFIKEIGRGKDGARDMTRGDAQTLYAAMLDGRVADLELGAVLLAMRIKGESIDEIAGFLDAARQHILSLEAPDGEFAPVIIPSYNGARKKANLTPMLAMLLAQRGVPVLVHGVTTDASRVTSADIFTALGILPASGSAAVSAAFLAHQPAMISIDALSPGMARLLNMRTRLGVRNSTHTLVKLLQPFTSPALRLYSYTHPEYLAMLKAYFSAYLKRDEGQVLMLRGTEGEVVASTGRAQQINLFAEGYSHTVLEKQEVLPANEQSLPEAIDAASTAQWIRSVLNGDVEIPENIAQQMELCLHYARELKKRAA